MNIKDTTLSLRDFILEDTPEFVTLWDFNSDQFGDYFIGGIQSPPKLGRFLWKKYEYRDEINIFEIKEYPGYVNILRGHWDKYIAKIQTSVARYEQASGISITINKVDELVQWSDG